MTAFHYEPLAMRHSFVTRAVLARTSFAAESADARSDQTVPRSPDQRSGDSGGSMVGQVEDPLKTLASWRRFQRLGGNDTETHGPLLTGKLRWRVRKGSDERQA
jgi:hypothetical protein